MGQSFKYNPGCLLQRTYSGIGSHVALLNALRGKSGIRVVWEVLRCA